MLTSGIESILFIAARPLTIKRLMELCDASKDDVLHALAILTKKYLGDESGIKIIQHGNEAQMVTSPTCAAVVQAFLKDETTGELTKPSLETLTIIAYRGPLTKAELEQIRGVNCSIILRHLLIRGLVEASGEQGMPQTSYRVTTEFVRFLGITSINELPEYETLRSHHAIEGVLSQ